MIDRLIAKIECRDEIISTISLKLDTLIKGKINFDFNEMSSISSNQLLSESSHNSLISDPDRTGLKLLLLSANAEDIPEKSRSMCLCECFER